MNVWDIYIGSNGNATSKMYAYLQDNKGTLGLIALNLFRAVKNSTRAKIYDKREHTQAAYERKAWSLKQLRDVLKEHASQHGITWGWARDEVVS